MAKFLSLDNKSLTKLEELKPILSVGDENNPILINQMPTGTVGYKNTMGLSSLGAIKNYLGFNWYGDEWRIGNIRSNGDRSDGFGIGFYNKISKVDDLFLRITPNGELYIKNNILLDNNNISIGSEEMKLNSIYVSKFNNLDTYITNGLMMNNNTSIEYNATAGKEWYVTIKLNRMWYPDLSHFIISCDYDNISGKFYLDLDSFNEKWKGYLTDYNHSNITGFARNSVDSHNYIYFKLRAPSTTQNITFSCIGNFSINSINASETKPNVTFKNLYCGDNRTQPIYVDNANLMRGRNQFAGAEGVLSTAINWVESYAVGICSMVKAGTGNQIFVINVSGGSVSATPLYTHANCLASLSISYSNNTITMSSTNNNRFSYQFIWVNHPRGDIW